MKEELQELKNGMGQNESLSAIDKKIGTSTDQTNATLFGAIAAHKKATDATDTKIGIASDQSTNTLFGLLKTLQAQRRFYCYSKTERKLEYQNVPTPAERDYYFKIHTFHAKYNGSIHVKLDIRQPGTYMNFYIMDLSSAELMDIADKSLVPNHVDIDTNTTIYKRHLRNESSQSYSMSCDLVVPVQAGHHYHFVISGSPYVNTRIASFELFYTEETL